MEVSDILEKVDILDYIQQFCDLEQRIDGEYWGLSPFKDENTPSFSVNPEKQMFYDFSSGTGGNLISFIRKYKDCDFITAINDLKKYANITEDISAGAFRLESSKVAKKFRTRSVVTKESKASVLPPDYMERFIFDKEKLQSWAAEGISLQTLKSFNVRYDTFSNRIVFPIKNYTGDIINVCGRTLDKDYKEKGLRKYTYFKPLGVLDTLYGYSDNKVCIQKRREIIIFEGAKSVMLASEWGIHNACAILTSHLNRQQMLFLAKLGVRVVFALDEDIDILKDENIKRLRRYAKIETTTNRSRMLDSKEAPVDKGLKVWERLYSERRAIN